MVHFAVQASLLRQRICIYHIAYHTHDCIHKRHQRLVMGTEVVLEISAIFNQLLAREYFINFSRHESFRSDISKI